MISEAPSFRDRSCGHLAQVAELVDAHGSGPCEATHGGSTPLDRTNIKQMQMHLLFSFLFSMQHPILTVFFTPGRIL